MPPVELMDTLKADRTILFSAEPFGDFFPRFALPPLLTDELDMRFEPAVKGTSSAGFHSFPQRRVTRGFRIHRHEITADVVACVSEQRVCCAKWWQC